tara:strand:- start:180 stop:1064 length:885 start_codon:yes stop_codon:yes gene_type:complete
MYAPQRESTEFGVDYARTGYQLQKEVEIEKQKQLDAQIAQSQQVRDIQEQEEAKRRKKGRKGQKVSAAATGATLGAQIGSAIPGVGTLIGGAIGGLGGYLFGEEGGMVPFINPDSLLYKQYQAGGDVTGYSGGQPKFLRRGYQNLQLRQEDVERAQENLDKMKSYGFWDAVGDLGKGYMAGKDIMSMVPESFMKDVSQYGLGDAFKHSVARSGDLDFLWGDKHAKTIDLSDSAIDYTNPFREAMKENVTRLGKEQNPWLNQTDEEFWGAGGGYVPTPARKSIYRDQARATKYLK